MSLPIPTAFLSPQFVSAVWRSQSPIVLDHPNRVSRSSVHRGGRELRNRKGRIESAQTSRGAADAEMRPVIEQKINQTYSTTTSILCIASIQHSNKGCSLRHPSIAVFDGISPQPSQRRTSTHAEEGTPELPGSSWFTNSMP